MKRDFVFLTLLLVAGLLAAMFLPPASAAEKAGFPGISPRQAGLDANQVKLLKALGVKILAPSYIPQGFRVYTVIAESRSYRVGGGPAYTIIYQGPGDKAFMVEGTSGGIGDPPADRTVPVNSPLFGQNELLINKSGGMDNKQTMLSGWFEGTNYYYHFTGAGYHQETRGSNNVSITEAKKIIESLRYVNL